MRQHRLEEKNSDEFVKDIYSKVDQQVNQNLLELRAGSPNDLEATK